MQTNLRTYRILYVWQERHYSSVMAHSTAYNALSAIGVLLMPGARPYAVEAING